MVTTIVPPIENPAIFHSFLLIIFNSKESSTTQNFKKVFIKFSCEVFPFPIFPPFKKPTRFVWGEWIQPTILGSERFPGVALCGLPRTSQLRHGVDEVQSAKGARVLRKPTEVDCGWKIFRDFFFSFFSSSEVSKFWCFWYPGSCFWFIVFDWYLLIEFEYGSLFFDGWCLKTSNRTVDAFPFEGGGVCFL